jgi:hypothetical protein
MIADDLERLPGGTRIDLDVDSIISAATHIIEKYGVKLADGWAHGIEAAPAKSIPPPDMGSITPETDNPIEELRRRIEALETLVAAVPLQLQPDIEKGGEMTDALAVELARMTSQSVLDIDAIMDEQRTMMLKIMQECAGMLELGHSLLAEIRHREEKSGPM